MADLKNYNTLLYCPDDPDDAETTSARKRGRKSVDKDDGGVTFEHRTAARGHDNSNSSNNNHSFGGLRFPGNFADNGGEGNSYQYNQYSSDYSDRGAQHQSVMMQSQAQPSQSMQQQLVQQQQQIMRQQQLMQQQLMQQQQQQHPITMQQMTQNHASMMAQPSYYPMQMHGMSMPLQTMPYAQGPAPKGGSGMMDPTFAASCTSILALYAINKNG